MIPCLQQRLHVHSRLLVGEALDGPERDSTATRARRGDPETVPNLLRTFHGQSRQ